MTDIIAMAREAGIADAFLPTPHPGVVQQLERFAELVRTEDRNKLAAWMQAQGYATGHGDTMKGLLEELEREIGFNRAQLWIKRINEAVLAEREAVENLLKEYDMATSAFAKDFRARGQA